MAAGAQSKLMGQINLTRAAIPTWERSGLHHPHQRHPERGAHQLGVSASTINGAIEHFVKAAACELPRGLPHQRGEPPPYWQSPWTSTPTSSRASCRYPPPGWRRAW